MNIRHTVPVAWMLAVAALAVVMTAGCSAIGTRETATREMAVDKRAAMDLFIQGKVAEAKEDYATAVGYYLEAHYHDPHSEDITLALTRVLIRDRKMKSALHFAEKARDINPSNPETWNMIHFLYQNMGRTDLAVEAFEKYIQLREEVSFADYVRLANYYFDLGKDKKASELLTSILNNKSIPAGDLLEAATILARNNRLEEAEKIYRGVIARDPLNEQAWLYLGQLFERTGQPSKAFETYNEGLAKIPDATSLHVQAGNLCLERNDWNCAITHFEHLLAAGVQSDKVQKTLTALYYYDGRDADARAMLEKLKEGGRDDASLYFSLGKVMGYLERFEEAVENYREGFGRVDDSVEQEQLLNAITGYISVLIELGRYDEAVTFIRDDASRVVESRENLKLIEASTYMEMERYDDAIAIYEWLHATDPSNNRYTSALAQAHAEKGNYAKAVEVLEEAGGETENVGRLIQLSIIHDRAGNFEQSEEALLRALEIEPENALVLNNLAYMYIEHDRNLDRALDMVRQALELNPNSGAYYDTLGWGHYKKGDYRKARENIEKALELEEVEGQGVIWDHYGDVLMELGDEDGAADAYRRAIELGEDTEVIREKLRDLR